MYKIFIRPHLDYGDVIYHIPHSYDAFSSSISLHPLMEKIEQIQYNAALAITGCWQGSNRNKLYDELGWESLSDRRWSRRLFYFYKIHNGLTPDYLKHNLPAIRDQSPRSCSVSMYHEVACKTSRYMNSFFPDSIKSWNNIGADFSSSTSIGQFKKNINVLIRPKPKPVFGIHDPVGLRFLFQLRVGLSPLNCHKCSHNFADTPTDWCNCHCAPEDTSHFLLSCDLFSLPRVDLRTSVSNILELNNLNHLSECFEIYIYGHHSLDDKDNKTILLSTIKFIKDTDRFS